MLDPEATLALVPQKPPFRFVDRLVSIDRDHAVGEYHFRGDEFFYSGHFPGNPVTPGVILIEAMCQTGLVALGIHLLSLETTAEELTHYTTLFTDANVEFGRIVRPGDTVRMNAERMVWRRRKLKSKVEMTLLDGTHVATGTVSGMAVNLDGK